MPKHEEGRVLAIANIKDLSDEDIIRIINNAQDKKADYTMEDLKVLLAETTNRKLKEHTYTLTRLMESEITGESEPSKTATTESYNKRPVAEKTQKEISPPREFDNSFAAEYDKYPVLSFLIGLFKFFAWLFLLISVVGGAFGGYVYFKGEIVFLIASVLSGMTVGMAFWLFFYAQSEKILLQLEIERNTRKK